MADQKNLIQRKLIISFSLIGAVLIAGSFFILQLSIDSTFRTLEADQSRKDAADVELAIEQQIESIAWFNRDYASWDETYEAMVNLESMPSYSERILSFEQWPDLDINIDGMLLFDTGGKLVAGTLFHHTEDKEVAIERVFSDLLTSKYNGFTTDIADPNLVSEISGFVSTPEGLLIVVSGPILKSDYSGESSGRFLTVHYLNPERLEEIGHRARVELELLPGTAVESETPSESHVVRHLPLKDILGNTVSVVEIRTPRDISLAGVESIRNAMWFLGIAILVTVILSWLALRQLMVQPLLSLKRHVSDMRETGSLASRYHSTVKDEVGTLADEIDFLAGNLDMSQTQLTIARDQAELSSRAKSEFLATMSHELRTPLNGVIGMTDVLIRSDLNAQQQGFAETVLKSGQTLLKLIDDILDFSNMSAGHTEIINARFKVEELLQEVGAVVSAAAEEKGLHYHVNLDHKLPDTVVADRQRLRMVLLNLLDNAVKFTHYGEVVLTIDCLEHSNSDDKETLILSFAVTDTGVGIEQENLGAIFDTFSQADGSTTREFGGTGLGLSISKGLVEMMGGEITVRSVHGEGSEFCFIVKVRTATLALKEDDRSAVQEAT